MFRKDDIIMRFLKIFKDVFFVMSRIVFRARYGWQTNVKGARKIKYFKSGLLVHPTSTATLGNNITLHNTRIIVGPTCTVHLGNDAVLKNVTLFLGHNADVRVNDGAILDYTHYRRGEITVQEGQLLIGEKANVKANLVVRFNARLLLGVHAGIGFNSEVVCDEFIQLGNYCLVSNHVTIYDSNSHSVDFNERRERIRLGYPDGCSEVEKPATAPIDIGSDVWIGKNATILKGAVIGEGSIVGMATTVTRGVYPAGSYIVSNQPRVIKA